MEGAAAADLTSACKAGLGHGLLLTLRYLVALLPWTGAQTCQQPRGAASGPGVAAASGTAALQAPTPDAASTVDEGAVGAHEALRQRVDRMLGLAKAMNGLALPPLGHGCAGFSGACGPALLTCTRPCSTLGLLAARAGQPGA